MDERLIRPGGPRLRPIADPTEPVYHRRIRLVSSANRVVGDVADGPHHFRVVLGHDGTQVTSIHGEAVRHPWTTCPAAVGALDALLGTPLDESSTAVGRHADATHQCTHLFDLAGLAVAQAARGGSGRDYHCIVRQDSAGDTLAQCLRDGQVVLDWRIRDGVILGPGPCAEVPLQRRFIQWAGEHLSMEQAEAAIVLRRAWFVSPVRFIDVEQWERASDLGNGPVCFTFQPGRAQTALRVPGSYRDVGGDAGDDPESLLEPS